MTRPLHRRLYLPLILLLCASLPALLRAQPSNSSAPAPVPAPSALVLQPPLKFFRELLAMAPAERERQFAIWPPAKLPALRAKIREYEAMTPQAREESLTATDLHWYLQLFFQPASTNSVVQLSQVPEPYRQMVSERLTQWKMLPPPMRQEVLAHESTRDFFLVGSRAQTNIVAPQMIPPPLRLELLRLDELPPEQRRQTYANFRNFFELTVSEKQAVLNALPADQRQKLEKTISGIDRLPREQRDLALRTLNQLAGFTDEQRGEFFKNMGRWKQLSPDEQQLWLKLANLLPPLPPMAPRPPPLPILSRATNPSH
jgi:hypothetical protein